MKIFPQNEQEADELRLGVSAVVLGTAIVSIGSGITRAVGSRVLGWFGNRKSATTADVATAAATGGATAPAIGLR